MMKMLSAVPQGEAKRSRRSAACPATEGSAEWVGGLFSRTISKIARQTQTGIQLSYAIMVKVNWSINFNMNLPDLAKKTPTNPKDR
jgi:RNA polymerase subunit RPABC4/transcription elongation factor Spt4